MNFKRLRHQIQLGGKWIRLANFDVIAKAKRDMASEMGLMMFREGLINIVQNPVEDADAVQIEMESYLIHPKTLKSLLARAWELGSAYGDIQALPEARNAFDDMIKAIKADNPGNVLGLTDND